jgi:hypothetical protein
MKKIIYLLVKIFKEADRVYADAFLKKGEMYCQTLKEFKKIEDNDTRGDEFEGVLFWIQPKDAIITLRFDRKIAGLPEEFVIKESALAAPTVIQTNEYDLHHIYCMYGVAIDEFTFTCSTEEEKLALQKDINNCLMKQIEIDKKVLELGPTAVVVTNVAEFINRVETRFGGKIHRGFIEYFDMHNQTKRFYGLNAIFKKRSQFAYQNEYRFAFETDGKVGAIKFKIGSLEDIAFKTTIDELRKSMKINV